MNQSKFRAILSMCVVLPSLLQADSALGGDRRDIVFDCPCTAQWTADGSGDSGTLTLRGNVRNMRATDTGEVRISRQWWTGRNGVSVGGVTKGDRIEGEWALDFPRPDTDETITLHLVEETSVTARGTSNWHNHESISLWVASSDTDAIEYVDLLTDTDQDGISDVNERLAGTSWEDPNSVPGESVVDLLLLYTDEFREAEEGYPYTRLLHLANVASTVFEDNNTNMRFRLVGMSEVELNENGWAVAEDRIALMDSHGADVTVQFGPTGPCASGGCARVGAYRDTKWSDASSWDASGSVMTTVHELGHVVGLVHSARQGELHGAWRWSRGHYVTPRLEEPRYGTIMAYGRNVLGGLFSNPHLDCGIGPCGVDAEFPLGADSVQTLNHLRFQVVAHREPAPDSDGDGFVDAGDAFPDDPNDWFDIDGDGVGDNADDDDDNDGTPDLEDAFPLDATEWADADLDGIGDNADEDVQDLSPFRDPELRSGVENALGKRAGASITAEDMESLTELRVEWSNVRDLTGLELSTELRELRLSGNRIIDLSPLADITNLEELYLGSNHVNDLTPLSNLKNLSVLSLNDNQIVDLSPISELTELVYLRLSDNLISDVSPLTPLSKLDYLNLESNPLSNIDPLSGLGTITRLYLSYTNVSSADVFELSYLDRIRELGLSGLDVTSISSLSVATELRRLELDENTVQDLSPLAALHSLARIDLGRNEVTDIGPMKDLVNLWSLDLRSNQISDISALSAMRELTWLMLDDNTISDLTPLTDLNDLSSLYLRQNSVSDLSALADKVELTDLRLNGNRVTDVSPLSRLTKLTRLELNDNSVVDLDPLADMHELRTLNIDRNRVADLSALAEMDQLWWLQLRDNSISDIGPLKDLVTLNTMMLGGNRISDLSALSAFTNIRWMTLTDNVITNIEPLVDRAIFGGEGSAGAYVGLDGNPLDAESVDEHIPTLNSWGVRARFARRGSEVTIDPIADPTLRELIAHELSRGSLHLDDKFVRLPIDQLNELRMYGQGVATLQGLGSAAGLERLYAGANDISDVSPLAELENLSALDLRNNRIVDVSPLADNESISLNDWVALDANPLSQDSLNVHVPVLLARGVQVSVNSVLVSLVARGDELRFDVSGYFDALLGTATIGSAQSDDAWIVVASVDEGEVVFTPGFRAGRATVSVQASGDDGVGSLEFIVSVRGPIHVPYLPKAGGDVGGFVRVRNRDALAGEVSIVAIDDAGTSSESVTLTIGANEVVHFTSDDLENGNADIGLSGGVGAPADGNWRLELESTLDLQVLAYVRNDDGYLAAMHDTVPLIESTHHVRMFHPDEDGGPSSKLRLVNPGTNPVDVTIEGIDDAGASPGGRIELQIPIGVATELSAADLERGTSAIEGNIGDGQGNWRLKITADGDLSVMNLVESSDGYIANLSSSAPATYHRGDLHIVPLFVSTTNSQDLEGIVRVTNQSDTAGVVRIQPIDDNGVRYEQLTLDLDAGQSVNLDASDLETGNEDKGLTGNAGSGPGDWRLELSSELDITVQTYARAKGNFLLSMHDAVFQTGRRFDVPMFNPADLTTATGKLRVVNPNTQPAYLSITGVDDAGSFGKVAQIALGAQGAVELTAEELESGSFDLRGALGDGEGNWRLIVDSEESVILMNLAASPTGHLTNLSTDPSPQAR